MKRSGTCVVKDIQNSDSGGTEPAKGPMVYLPHKQNAMEQSSKLHVFTTGGARRTHRLSPYSAHYITDCFHSVIRVTEKGISSGPRAKMCSNTNGSGALVKGLAV